MKKITRFKPGIRVDRFSSYLWLFPAILMVSWICLYPGLSGFVWSLFETRFVKLERFIGFSHYLTLWSDTRIHKALLNSTWYVLGSLAISIPLGLLLSLILSRPLRFRAAIRTVLIMPWVISQTITALLWVWMLNPSFGLINYWLVTLGFNKIDFLGDPNSAMLSLVLVNVWRSFPFPMVMFLAALQSIPEHIYEAASVDGVTGCRAFFSITLPLIKSTILITVIMCFLDYFNMVTMIFIMTAGGPGGSTETLSYLVFSDAFLFWRLGSAAALGFTMFLCNALFSISYLRLIQRGEAN